MATIASAVTPTPQAGATSAKEFQTQGTPRLRQAESTTRMTFLYEVALLIGFAVAAALYAVLLRKTLQRRTAGSIFATIVAALILGLVCIAVVAGVQTRFRHGIPTLNQSFTAILARFQRTPESTSAQSPIPTVTQPKKPWEDFQSKLIVTRPEQKNVGRSQTPTPQATVQRELSAAEVARATFRSVVMLLMQDERGQTRSLGSGFFIEKNIVATNYHVVSRASGGYAKIIGRPVQLNIRGVVALDTTHDLTLLELDESNAEPLQLADTSSVSVGDTVYAVGNPLGLEGTFSQGIVSSMRELRSVRLLQITAAISPGNSGGPVVDHTGKVVGVAVGTDLRGQNVNFAISVEHLAALMQNKSAIRPLASVAQATPSGLFAQVGGQEIRNGVVGENLTYDDPSIQTGHFSFSLRNKLKRPIANVSGVVVFHDMHGEPIDIYPIRYADVIPAGLAKRIAGHVDASVERLNCPDKQFPYVSNPPRTPKGKIEFRVFDFALPENAEVNATQSQ